MRNLSFPLLVALALPLAHSLAADSDAPPTPAAAPSATPSATPFPLPKTMIGPKKKSDDMSGPTKISAPYDKNKNGVLDLDEIEAVRKDFAANPNGPLKQFDVNHDGILDDEEVARIPLPKVKAPKKKATNSSANKLLGGGSK